MAAGSPLKVLLSEQARQLDAISQPAVSARAYLTHISPLLSESSPSRSRVASASPQRGEAPAAATPSAVRAIANEEASASRQPADGAVPATPNAYMNDLPLPPYGSKSHLSLHVKETLELAVRVLAKNKQIGGSLSDHDLLLIAEIAAFAVAKPSGASGGSNNDSGATDPSAALQDVVV